MNDSALTTPRFDDVPFGKRFDSLLFAATLVAALLFAAVPVSALPFA